MTNYYNVLFLELILFTQFLFLIKLKQVILIITPLKDYTFLDINFICTYGYMSDLIFALSTFRNKVVRVLTRRFLRSIILWYVQHFQWVENSFFSECKTSFSQFTGKFLKFEEMEYLTHHVKFENWRQFCVNSRPLFQL